jgi:predicted nucleic acid-binding protein
MGQRVASTSARTILFDTDILIWYFRGHERARRFLARVPHPRRAVSALTVMELLQGCRSQEADFGLATANTRHDRQIPRLHLVAFKP